MFFIRNRKAPRRGSICSGPELPSRRGWEGPGPWGEVGRELPGRPVPLAAVGGASRVPPERACRVLAGCRCPNKAFSLLTRSPVHTLGAPWPEWVGPGVGKPLGDPGQWGTADCVPAAQLRRRQL